MIGQPIIGAAKIVTLVFETGAEIPFAGNEKAMVVAEIVIIRIALAQSWILFEIAAQRINRLEGKDIVRIFVLWFRGLLHLRFGPRKCAGGGEDGKDARGN